MNVLKSLNKSIKNKPKDKNPIHFFYWPVALTSTSSKMESERWTVQTNEVW